ncbi:hypothetical protein C8Q73DRAFT_689684 [Cubamyces lactineus]|nr:hypothetical protein C8Q73DRAFT_689684 [Cubamyces lactineus]
MVHRKFFVIVQLISSTSSDRTFKLCLYGYTHVSPEWCPIRMNSCLRFRRSQCTPASCHTVLAGGRTCSRQHLLLVLLLHPAGNYLDLLDLYTLGRVVRKYRLPVRVWAARMHECQNTPVSPSTLAHGFSF